MLSADRTGMDKGEDVHPLFPLLIPFTGEAQIQVGAGSAYGIFCQGHHGYGFYPSKFGKIRPLDYDVVQGAQPFNMFWWNGESRPPEDHFSRRGRVFGISPPAATLMQASIQMWVFSSAPQYGSFRPPTTPSGLSEKIPASTSRM